MRFIRVHTACVLVALGVLAPTAGAQGLVGFQSPTRNIGCSLDATNARCDIRKRDWSPPKKPANCELDWGQGLDIGRTGSRGRFFCAGDTALGAGKALAYGKSITRGGITCTSRKSGMTCKNARGHGFRISRGSYRTF